MPAPAIARATSIPPWIALSDPDVRTYVRAVEAADGATLELPVRKALHEFITGCKADGIWTAIKASCILAGARTLTGALVPLVGAAPTSFNFVSGDYNRKTGLVGNGSTKYLDSNRNNNTDPQNSFHMACHATTIGSGTAVYIGGGTTTNETGISNLGRSGTGTFIRNRTNVAAPQLTASPVGFVATSRASTTGHTRRANGAQDFFAESSQTLSSFGIAVFAATGGVFPTDARLAFYSIGESLDLTLLDARVTQLITTFAVVIP